MELKHREWLCPKCETKHDRDFNASKNIEKEGVRILEIKNKEKVGKLETLTYLCNEKIGLSSPELTPLESKSIDTQ